MLGYGVLCFLEITKYASGVQGGLGLIFWYRPKVWIIELTRFHRPNVSSFEIVASNKRTPLISAYLLPSTLEHLTDLEEAMTRFRYQEPILIGEPNKDIRQYHNPHSQQVLDSPIGIDILMNLRTHQGSSARARAYAYNNYTNCPPIQDARNTEYANLHRNYKLESTLITHQRVPTD